jgi:hypothetical protein
MSTGAVAFQAIRDYPQYTPMSELDALIAAGFGDIPQVLIPKNWRDVDSEGRKRLNLIAFRSRVERGNKQARLERHAAMMRARKKQQWRARRRKAAAELDADILGKPTIAPCRTRRRRMGAGPQQGTLSRRAARSQSHSDVSAPRLEPSS